VPSGRSRPSTFGAGGFSYEIAISGDPSLQNSHGPQLATRVGRWSTQVESEEPLGAAVQRRLARQKQRVATSVVVAVVALVVVLVIILFLLLLLLLLVLVLLLLLLLLLFVC